MPKVRVLLGIYSCLTIKYAELLHLYAQATWECSSPATTFSIFSLSIWSLTKSVNSLHQVNFLFGLFLRWQVICMEIICFQIKTIISILTCHLKSPSHPPHKLTWFLWIFNKLVIYLKPVEVTVVIHQVAGVRAHPGGSLLGSFSFGGSFKCF